MRYALWYRLPVLVVCRFEFVANTDGKLAVDEYRALTRFACFLIPIRHVLGIWKERLNSLMRQVYVQWKSGLT